MRERQIHLPVTQLVPLNRPQLWGCCYREQQRGVGAGPWAQWWLVSVCKLVPVSSGRGEGPYLLFSYPFACCVAKKCDLGSGQQE